MRTIATAEKNNSMEPPELCATLWHERRIFRSFGESDSLDCLRVGAAGGAIGWILLQVVDVAAPILGMPGWKARFVFLTPVIGAPGVLVLA
jgi:hypothetical protein